MPRLVHEGIVQLIRNAPDLITRLLPKLAAPGRLHVTAAEIVDVSLPEYRADAVLLRGPVGAPTAAFVIEVQGTPDPRKRFSWPLLVAGTHARHCCPVDLIVVALNAATVREHTEPIIIGDRCCVVTPVLITRDMVPWITDLDVARACPELAVASAMTHGAEPGGEAIAFTALTAARTLDGERGLLYPDFVVAGLPRAARLALEKLMDLANYKFHSALIGRPFRKGLAEGRAQGKLEGKIEMLLQVIALKGLRPTRLQRERILACADERVLKTWTAQIVAGSSLSELFKPADPPARRRARRP